MSWANALAIGISTGLLLGIGLTLIAGVRFACWLIESSDRAPGDDLLNEGEGA